MNKPVDPAVAGLAAAASARGSGPAREAGPSLRSWLETLEAHNQLRRIDVPVDWDEEIGAIARVNIALQGPGLFFRNIRDYRDNDEHQVRHLRDRQQGPDTPDARPAGGYRRQGQTVRHLKDAYRNPVRPVTVDHGPCKENVLTGEAIDLEQFPAPRWHATDGGKFIDTFCGVITHDPATDRPNIGLYRGQVLGRGDRIGKLLVPTQGWGDHFLKYRDAKGRMPVAVSYGWHDVMPFCAGSPFPKHVCEWDMMGAILGRPVELIDCETVPLQVPASSEIVVEGWIDPDPVGLGDGGPVRRLSRLPRRQAVAQAGRRGLLRHPPARPDHARRAGGRAPRLPVGGFAALRLFLVGDRLEHAGGRRRQRHHRRLDAAGRDRLQHRRPGAQAVSRPRPADRHGAVGHQRWPVVLQECHGGRGGYRHPRSGGAGMGLCLPGERRARRRLAGRADLRLGARPLDPARGPGRAGPTAPASGPAP